MRWKSAVMWIAAACLAAGPAIPNAAEHGHGQGVATHAISRPKVRSESALVIDQSRGQVLFAKNSREPCPIASITKLITAMVVLDARLPMDERITITRDDMDRIKNTGSRLRVGSVLTRHEALQLALMASENRAASALARTYPGGLPAFVQAMNRKARQVGMKSATFVDPTGLDSRNVASAEDLAWMLRAAYRYPVIRQMTTTRSYVVRTPGKARHLKFRNTNVLVRRNLWDIGLSKTGYINEAGRCLVMQVHLVNRPLLIVLLNAWGKYTPIGDSNRIRRWLERHSGELPGGAVASAG